MKVQVFHTLARLVTAVVHDAIIRDALLLADMDDHFKAVGNDGGIFRCQFVGRRDVLPGHHQEMDRRLRRHIIKRHRLLVFIELLAGDLAADDLAKQAIFIRFHEFLL